MKSARSRSPAYGTGKRERWNRSSSNDAKRGPRDVTLKICSVILDPSCMSPKDFKVSWVGEWRLTDPGLTQNSMRSFGIGPDHSAVWDTAGHDTYPRRPASRSFTRPPTLPP